jgi:arsenical pump membrane protein
VFRWFFAADLGGYARSPRSAMTPTPRFALTVLALILAGFAASSFTSIPPVTSAVAGAAVLAGRALVRQQIGARRLIREASPLFCLFVLALGVVVAGVTAHGLGAALGAILPAAPTLPGLLVVAGMAATLSNVVNNLPATLVLLGALGPVPHPGLVLAALLGVNIGPNLTYVDSLATLLWRRVLAGRNAAPTLWEFVRLGTLTVPTCLAIATLTLWLGLTIGQQWLP